MLLELHSLCVYNTIVTVSPATCTLRPLLTEALEMQARLPAAMCIYHMGFILQEVQMALPDQQDTLRIENLPWAKGLLVI